MFHTTAVEHNGNFDRLPTLLLLLLQAVWKWEWTWTIKRREKRPRADNRRQIHFKSKIFCWRFFLVRCKKKLGMLAIFFVIVKVPQRPKKQWKNNFDSINFTIFFFSFLSTHKKSQVFAWGSRNMISANGGDRGYWGLSYENITSSKRTKVSLFSDQLYERFQKKTNFFPHSTFPLCWKYRNLDGGKVAIFRLWVTRSFNCEAHSGWASWTGGRKECNNSWDAAWRVEVSTRLSIKLLANNE